MDPGHDKPYQHLLQPRRHARGERWQLRGRVRPAWLPPAVARVGCTRWELAALGAPLFREVRAAQAIEDVAGATEPQNIVQHNSDTEAWAHNSGSNTLEKDCRKHKTQRNGLF